MKFSITIFSLLVASKTLAAIYYDGTVPGSSGGIVVDSVAYATNSGTASNWVGSTGVWTKDAIVTNAVDSNKLPLAGGTITGPVLDTTADSLSPSADQLVKASWVRGLFPANTTYYSSDATNTSVAGLGAVCYSLLPIPTVQGSRVYSTGLTNNAYLGFVATTNKITASGNVVVQAYISATGAGGGQTLTIHPEIYATPNGTNQYGDWDTANQTITLGGVTNLYTFVIPMTGAGITNDYAIRKFHIGAANNVTSVRIHYGTNTPSSVGFVQAGSAAAVVSAGGLTNITGAMIVGAGGLTNVTAAQVVAAGALTNITQSMIGAAGGLTNLVEADTNALAKLDIETNRAIQAEALLLPKSGGTMTGILDMGGYSITNIGTNSLTFLDGTKVSVLSNGVIGVSKGGTNTVKTLVDSGNIDAYAPAAPTYYADGSTLRKAGTTFSVSSWIPNNLIKLWYSATIDGLIAGTSFLDGPSYLFTDQNGILPALSTNQIWANPGYRGGQIGTSTNASTSLIAHYKMNDNNETVDVTDSIGNCPATNQVNTSTKSEAGKINSALRFDGSADYISVASTPFENNDYTLSLWVNIGELPGDYATLIGITTGDQLFSIRSDVGFRITSYCDGGIDSVSVGTLPDTNTWYHVVVTRDTTANELNLYVDGLQIGTGTTLTSPTASYDSTDVLFIGERVAGGGGQEGKKFNGLLDDVRIYNAALSSEDIAAIYNSGIGTENYIGTAILPTPLYLTATNKVLSFVASNAIPTTILYTTNATALTTNDLQLGMVDMVSGLTNWSTSVSLLDSTDVSNQLYTAGAITVGGSNLAPIVWVSSNVSVTVKGMAAPCAP